jgi:hypothetical protein
MPKYAVQRISDLYVAKMNTKDEMQNLVSDYKRKGVLHIVWKFHESENVYTQQEVYEMR